MELCSGKGLEMLYFTNEIMKQRVSGLGEEHRKLYKFFADYYRELNTAPLIEDMVLEMRASSKEKVYSLLSDLAAEGLHDIVDQHLIVQLHLVLQQLRAVEHRAAVAV